MGEDQNQPFQPPFNASPKIDFQESRVTPDGGLILARELDERLGFGDLIAQHRSDSQRGRRPNFHWPICFARQPTAASRAIGDVNDAERLSQDPTIPLIGSERI